MKGKSYSVEFLFDSGAKISIMSIADERVMDFTGGSFVKGVGGDQAIGKAISCSFTLDCLPEQTFEHSIKPSKIPGEPSLVLLGIDFLSKFNLTVFDWENQRLLLGDEWVYLTSSEANTPSNFDISSDLDESKTNSVRRLIDRYAGSVFAHNPRAPKRSSIGVHTITTKSSLPHKDKFRRTPLKWRESASQQIDEMLANKIIQKSSSPYSSNPVLVSKTDGSKRFCVDFRSLNSNTVKDTYPLPSVEDMLDRFKGCNFFSQLDLASGYWGIPVHPKDIEKTAFAAHKGKYEFLRMPFGLCNAQSTFQRSMDELVQKVHADGLPGVDAYVDNFIVFSKTFEEHMDTLERLLHYVDFYNLSLRCDKCEFFKPEIEFLGFIITGETVKPSPNNVRKVREFPRPKTRRQLQQFIGVANFNRKFVPNYAVISSPLTKLTSKKVKFEWGPPQDEAFQKIKDCLSEAPNLCLADWSKEFHIQTDASNVAAGAVLYQLGENKEQLPLAYYSKKLKKAEKNWSATEKEMWAIILASRKWYPYCAGKVVFHTDHQPLKYIRKQKDPRGKIANWIMELENIDYKVEYIPGKDNTEADYLSRVESDAPDPIEHTSMQELASIYLEEAVIPTLDVVKEHQKKDKHFADARAQLLSAEGIIKKGIFKSYKSMSVKEDLLHKGERIMIPESLQEHVMREYHGQHHPGAENSILLIKARFYWRGMERHVKEFVAACRTCVQCKVSKKQHSETQIPATPKCRERLCIDIACMPRSNKGNVCFLQMLDANTKFVTTVALADQQAETIKEELWPKWFAYFGIPNSLLSDQGPNVDGRVIRELCKQLKILKMHSSPYHPEGNGSTERSIGSVKTIIRSMCQARSIAVEDWDKLLEEATLAYNNTVNKSTGFSPFRSMFGNDATLPLDNACNIQSAVPNTDPALIRENAELNRKEAQSTYKNRLDLEANTVRLKVGDRVLLKRNFGDHPKLSVKWKEDTCNNPYVIIKRYGPVNYVLRNSKGVEKLYQRNQIKPALERTEPLFNPTPGEVDSEPPTARPINIPARFAQENQQPTPGIDRIQFTENFFRSVPQPAQAPDPPATRNLTPTAQPPRQPPRASSRITKAVVGNRLVDQVGGEY